jgi:hypothetical protein
MANMPQLNQKEKMSSIKDFMTQDHRDVVKLNVTLTFNNRVIFYRYNFYHEIHIIEFYAYF